MSLSSSALLLGRMASDSTGSDALRRASSAPSRRRLRRPCRCRRPPGRVTRDRLLRGVSVSARVGRRQFGHGTDVAGGHLGDGICSLPRRREECVETLFGFGPRVEQDGVGAHRARDRP